MRSLKVGIVLAILVFATSAFAGTIGTFTYKGTGVSFSGVLSGTLVVPGEYALTGVTGTYNGAAVTGLLPVGADPNYLVDNLFFTSSPYASNTGNSGFVFGVTGSPNVNFWFDQNVTDYSSVNVGGFINTPVTAAFSNTPEPSTLLTLGSGLIGLAGLARKRLFS